MEVPSESGLEHAENVSVIETATTRDSNFENRFCINPRLKSATSASAAAGIAPARMSRLSTIDTPRKINIPSPPAPTAAAIVATPTAITVATRIPAKITPMARGISTFHRSCASVMPMARPASRIAGSTPDMPVNVFRMIGSNEYSTSATIAVRVPIPPMNGSGIKKPNKARLGTVCTIFATARMGRLNRGLRVIRIPTGRPIATAMSIEIPTISRCSAINSSTSDRRVHMNSNTFMRNSRRTLSLQDRSAFEIQRREPARADVRPS
jgi:hypothetical protein